MQKFSVLMSVYSKERPEYLAMCFDSIARQTLQPDEIVLVEDGPLTNELYEAIEREEKRFPCLKRVPLVKNQGLGVALNIGMQHCTHDIIARMDTDDICLPERFKVQTEYMEAHPEVDVLGAWITEFEGEPTNVVGVRNVPESHEEIFSFGKQRNPTNHPVVMLRKKAVLDAGGYLSCPLFEDYYLWGRMMMRGSKFHNIQQPLLLFRRSPEMIRRRGGFTYTRYEVNFLRKLHEAGYITKLQLMRNMMQRYIVRLMPNSLRSILYKHLLRA